MTRQEIYDGVMMNGTTDFALIVETLRRHGASGCVIGGLAVNPYVPQQARGPENAGWGEVEEMG